MAYIISADELKKTIVGYNPKKSHTVHRASTKLADKLFAKAVKDPQYKKVILLSGGGASGKTEFLSEYLINKPAVILDGTLPSFEGASIKARLARKQNKAVKIIAIWPKDLMVAFSAFLQRDRKYPDEYFYSTHSQSRRALLEIAQSDLNIDIEIYENAFKTDNLAFYQYIFSNKNSLIEFIKANQYTENEILRIVGTSHD